MNTDQLLEKVEKLIEPMRTQLYEQGANIVRVVQGQRRLEQGQPQNRGSLPLKRQRTRKSVGMHVYICSKTERLKANM